MPSVCHGSLERHAESVPLDPAASWMGRQNKTGGAMGQRGTGAHRRFDVDGGVTTRASTVDTVPNGLSRGTRLVVPQIKGSARGDLRLMANPIPDLCLPFPDARPSREATGRCVHDREPGCHASIHVEASVRTCAPVSHGASCLAQSIHERSGRVERDRVGEGF